MSGECDICGVMGCVESNHKEPPVSDAKPYYKITPWHDERTGDPLWYVDGPTGRVTCHSEGEAAFAFMLLESAFASAAASRDGEVEDWPWVDASKAHPQHGLSVAIIPEGDERIAVGFWDKELENSRRAYIVDGPNGSHHVRALWWSYLPPKPSALAPGNGGEGEK